jgi:2,4-dienoyl-CoA reductase-like NADH-dependent reductase (Old Yellow Enzyme family)
MRRHEPFRFPNPDALLKKAESLGVQLPFLDSVTPLLAPGQIAGKLTPNRIAVQPMEGFDGTPAGAPGDLTFRRYRRYVEGGSGLIWFEACSVAPFGRSNPSQLMLTEGTLSEFQRLVAMTRQAARDRFGSACDPYLVLQLTHSGRFSKIEKRSKRKVACFNPFLDASADAVELFSDNELDDIRDQFIAAAVLTRQAGFDAVDIKACHGYLLHELLSARTRTDSRYGGPFQNRTRLLLDVVEQIRTALPGLTLAVRMNATDGIPSPYGFGAAGTEDARPDFSEPLQLQQMLVNAGCGLFNITAGIPAHSPHIGRPFDRPVKGAKFPDVHPLSSVSSLIQWAAVFQKAQPLVPVVGTGYSWLRHFWPNVGAAVLAGKGASFIGLGRNAFAYPDAPLDLMNKGKLNPSKCCNACSCCTELMRDGQVTGCVIRDRPIYRSAYANIKK